MADVTSLSIIEDLSKVAPKSSLKLVYDDQWDPIDMVLEIMSELKQAKTDDTSSPITELIKEMRGKVSTQE